MKSIWQIIFGVFLLILCWSCNKQVSILNDTDFTIRVERNSFEDTIYKIINFNVTSTSDSILDYGQVIVRQENGDALVDTPWRDIRNFSFGLLERRAYYLTVEFYTIGPGGVKQIILSQKEVVDNNRYPNYLVLKTITIDSSALEPGENGMLVSSSYSTAVWIWDLLAWDEEYENIDEPVYYYRQSFAPQSLTFDLKNLTLSTRIHDKSDWRYYEVNVGYPLVIGSSLVEDRNIYFRFDIEQMLEEEFNLNTTIVKKSDDSDYGGAYTGSIEYEWIYEK